MVAAFDLREDRRESETETDFSDMGLCSVSMSVSFSLIDRPNCLSCYFPRSPL